MNVNVSQKLEVQAYCHEHNVDLTVKAVKLEDDTLHVDVGPCEDCVADAENDGYERCK